MWAQLAGTLSPQQAGCLPFWVGVMWASVSQAGEQSSKWYRRFYSWAFLFECLLLLPPDSHPSGLEARGEDLTFEVLRSTDAEAKRPGAESHFCP